ncbi:Ribonuclease H2 subunit C [Geranomyces variabilis]|nr:Ribonuclease H2 subunit C [Geranomyces variabilis]
MSEVIQLQSLPAYSVVETPKLHLLPCQIDHNGPANVSSFFVVESNPDCPSTVQSAFRGRSLQGVRAKVPANYQGVIYREDDSHPSKERALKAAGSFETFVAWGHDDLPTTESNDVMRMLAWLEIAEDLHNHFASTAGT